MISFLVSSYFGVSLSVVRDSQDYQHPILLAPVDTNVVSNLLNIVSNIGNYLQMCQRIRKCCSYTSVPWLFQFISVLQLIGVTIIDALIKL